MKQTIYIVLAVVCVILGIGFMGSVDFGIITLRTGVILCVGAFVLFCIFCFLYRLEGKREDNRIHKED